MTTSPHSNLKMFVNTWSVGAEGASGCALQIARRYILLVSDKCIFDVNGFKTSTKPSSCMTCSMKDWHPNTDWLAGICACIVVMHFGFS